MYRSFPATFVADVPRRDVQNPPGFQRPASSAQRGRRRCLLAAALVCAALVVPAVAPQPANAHRRSSHSTARDRLNMPTDAGAAVATSAQRLSERH